MRLRIIAGEFKGRLINAPQSDKTRPTTDRVRESVFNYLQNKIDFEETDVLDIYSGSGSLGLEALSRGASTVTFVEFNFVPHKVLTENVHSLDKENRTKIFKTQALTFIRKTDKKFGLILADPPFFAYDIYEVVDAVRKHDVLAENGIMLIERSIQTIERDTEAFAVEPYRRIGDTCLYELS